MISILKDPSHTGLQISSSLDCICKDPLYKQCNIHRLCRSGPENCLGRGPSSTKSSPLHAFLMDMRKDSHVSKHNHVWPALPHAELMPRERT